MVNKEGLQIKCSQMNDLACFLAQVGSWTLDVATMGIQWSEETYVIYDLELGHILNLKTMLHILQGKSKEKLEKAIQLAIDEKKPFDIELEMITIKGSHKWIRSIGVPVEEEGHVVRINGAVQDITKMRDVMMQAEQKESIMESFFEVIPDLCFVIDRDGIIRDYRAQKQTYLYASPEQFLHKSFKEVVPPEISELLSKNLQLAFKNNTMTRFEYELLVPSGLHYFECRLNKIPNEAQCIAVVRDITEQYLATQTMKESSLRYRNLLDNSPFPIVITRLQDNHLCYTNQLAKNRFGFYDDEYLAVHASRFYHKPKERAKLIERLQSEKVVTDFEVLLLDWKGVPFWALMSASIVEFEDEPAMLVAINDISARKEIEDALRVSEEKYRLLTEYTSDVIWVFNVTQQCFTYISPSVEALTGYTVEEAIGKSIEDTIINESLSGFTDILTEGLDAFTNDLQSKDSYIVEVQQPCKDGTVIWVEFSLKFRSNAQGEIEVFGVSRNIEERKKMEREVLYLSYHDQLTGLYNRRYYEECVRLMDNEHNLPISIIMADVNGLKLTNDAFGHLNGDKLLKTFANVLKHECRKNDIIARIGGDEFVVLLPRTTATDAEHIVNRIRNTIANQAVADQINLSVSFGWQAKHSVEQQFMDVYKEAEDYMYRHKLFEGKSYKGATLKLIIKTLYEKYPTEKLHSERVSELCKKLGQALQLSSDEVNELGMVGLLHDIGKIGLDEHVLNKTEKLDEDEWKLVERHPEIGYQILRSVSEFAEIAEVVLAHHERLDGTGYPKGLKGDAIPYMSKIVAVVGAYDTMINQFAYKQPLSMEAAIQELKRNVGTQFDRHITKVFVEQVLEASWE